MQENRTITIARGDGIGPEIMEATLKVLDAAKAPFNYEEVKLGKDVFLDGYTSGISPEAWDTIRKNKLLLKSPITTPQGKGYKSLNVTIRKTLGLFANVRPCRALAPYVPTKHPGMDVVIIRENEEDLYAGIEHRQTQEVTQVLKLITRPGSEKIIRYAFEYARTYGRKKVTCFSKDNIMKITDGLFHRTFDRVAKEYPDIESDHRIIDIGSAILSNRPHQLDVVVTENLYGDIVSDIAAELSGSVGMGGSKNVGNGVAMFEAVHGSAPDIAGQGIANPSGLINAAVQMLLYLGETPKANLIENAWLRTLEDGYHTGDIYRANQSKKMVGTDEFADAVAERLGEAPKKLKAAHYPEKHSSPLQIKVDDPPKQHKELVGVDVFIDWDEAERDPETIGNGLHQCDGDGLKLKMITNRGVKVFPGGMPETFCTDHWRCRFTATDDTISRQQLLNLLQRLTDNGWDIIKTENLYRFDGEIGYSLGQGE